MLGDISIATSLCEVAEHRDPIAAEFERAEVSLDLLYGVLYSCARKLSHEDARVVADQLANCGMVASTFRFL